MNIIRIMHREVGADNPLADDYYITMTLRGARRQLGDNPVRKRPITPEMLHNILRNINIGNPTHAAVWAAALLMFYGLLRRSNVIPTTATTFNPQLHFRRKDATFSPAGVDIHIRWSKTNQYRSEQRHIPFPRVKQHPLCPTQALYHAFSLTPEAPTEGPALVTGAQGGGRGITSTAHPPLTAPTFWAVVKQALITSGTDHAEYGTHSFRRGGSCLLFNTGTPVSTIRELGGWVSNAYTAYIIADTSGLARTTAAMAAALPRT